VLGGVALGHRLVDMYHLFFRFPELEFQLDRGVLVAAGGERARRGHRRVGRGAPRRAAAARGGHAARTARELPARRSSSGSVSAARSRVVPHGAAQHRAPAGRALLTSVALALATGILVVPSSFRDGINHVLDYQWDLIQRQTVFVALIEPGPARTLADLRALPGVVQAEPMRGAPVELRGRQPLLAASA
jgi:putative ABC transport system permease protein